MVDVDVDVDDKKLIYNARKCEVLIEVAGWEISGTAWIFLDGYSYSKVTKKVFHPRWCLDVESAAIVNIVSSFVVSSKVCMSEVGTAELRARISVAHWQL